MVYVEFQYLYKKRNIFIEGEVDKTTFHYVTLLQKATQRFYLNQLVDSLTKFFHYQNQQLGSVLIVLLSVILTEATAHFLFNTGLQGGYAHLVTIGLVIYAFVMQVLFHRQYKIYLLGLLEIILSIGVGVISKYQITDYNITGYFLGLNSACLMIGIGKKLMEQDLENKIFAIFEFESNLLIVLYFISKFLHFYLPYFNNQPLNSFNLIPVIACMMALNSVKIWNLFQFNPVYLIGFLISVQKEEMQELQKLSLFDEILQMGHEMATRAAKTQLMNTLTVEKQINTNLGIQKSVSNMDKKTSLPSNVLQDNDSVVESVNEMLSHESSDEGIDMQPIYPYTKLIWVPFVLNFVFATTLITLIIFQKYSNQSLYLMSLGLFKMNLVILYCESQSVIMAQTERHAFFYLLSLVNDLWMGGHLAFMYWFYECFAYENEYCNFSLVVHAFIPIGTRILYKMLSEQSVQRQSNQCFVSYFICWVFLISIRQTIVIAFPSSSFYFVYLVIDTFLLIYFTFMYLTMGKSEFYRWLIEELDKMRKMRKYKLYVMQNLRNWRYDVTELSQTLFLINQIILFLGYNRFMRDKLQNSRMFQVEYFVICGSGLMAHLLQCYNNYYTQIELEQYEKPKYSPYFNYVILMIASGTYVLVTFLGNFQPDNQNTITPHKYYSLLTVGLCIFLTFTNLFNHYSYDTVQQFRHASKPINLIITYFIFYYPFITVFTVFFYVNNLQTGYIFRFAIAGFAYLTLASVTMGILVHAILNLTEKSKRTLFLIKALNQQFRKINMKQDGLFISMLQNMYDIMDGNSQKLLLQLKTQKIAKIITHDDLNVQYDYSIVEPQKKQNQYVKVFADIGDKNDQRPTKSRKLILHTNKSISKKTIETKINFFKKQSLQNNSKLKSTVIQIRKNKIQNKNFTEIKRLIEATIKVQSDNRMKKSFQGQTEFREILKNKDKISENMHRFFHFLSDPEEEFDFQMFKLLNSLLKVTNKNDLQFQFNKFSTNGFTINEQSFRDFIVDFMKTTYKNSAQTEDPSKLWSLFLQNHLFMFINKGNDIFKYYMKRKNVQMTIANKRVWESIKNEQKEKEMIDFRLKYTMRKHKALGKKGRNSLITIERRVQDGERDMLASNQLETILAFEKDEVKERSLEKVNPVPVQEKKHILFMTAQQIYTLLVEKLVQTLHDYEKIEHENFKLQEFSFGMSNIISILTKLFDFTYLYMYGSIYAMYAYGNEDFSNNKYILSFVNYDIVFGVALVGVVAYVGLIMFHKKEFTNGSLGVDENQRAISFTNLKFYTTFLLFLMGSSFANVFIMTSLNSYICEEQSQLLWNFPDNACYTTAHMMEMFGSLLILLTYYPLASLIFPFSSAIDQTLQIKYKAEYEIVYLQSKFLVNGINVIFNQLNFQTQELIKSASKTFVCIVLAILFHKLRPCSVEFINKIELKIYIALAIVNGAGILCYFLDLYVTIIILLIVLMIFFIYLLCTSVKISNSELKTTNPDSNTLVNDRFKKQEIFKIRLQQCNEPDFPDNEPTMIKSKSEYLYSDIDSHDNAPSEFLKQANYDTDFYGQDFDMKGSKFKRKINRSNNLTIKMMEKKQRGSGEGLKLSPRLGEQIDMIPARKKTGKGHMFASDKVRN